MEKENYNLIERATFFAIDCHKGQKRKISGIPYILHPMEVASVAATLTNDEEVIAACLLHDTIEDCGISKEQISEMFGERTAMLVMSETENKRPEMPKEESWKIRKVESIEELKKSTDIGTKVLWLSDKLSNARSLYDGYVKDGDKVFERFHVKDKKEHEWYYRTICENVVELKSTYAFKEYEKLINIIFGGNK